MSLNYTVINGKKIMLEEVCHECCGTGTIYKYTSNYPDGIEEICKNGACDEGQINIYYTPEKLEEITGDKLPDDHDVFVNFGTCVSKDIKWIVGKFKGSEDYKNVLVKLGDQQAPEADYRSVKS